MISRIPLLIEGLTQEKGGLASYWTVLTLIRWLIMGPMLILLTDYPAQQLQLLVPLTILSTTLQAIVSPQERRVERQLSLFNEVMASLYIYALIGLSLAEEPTVRSNMGLALLTITLATVFVNLLKAIICIGKECFHRCRESTLFKQLKAMLQRRSKYTIKVKEDDAQQVRIPIKVKETFTLERYTKTTQQSFSHTDLTVKDLL
ncbi:hypothetical protein FGO68_gene5061 [Halteria grandinella]|uniref:Uncharacterized protein n=1 Tax=Halteria grandinella TaxID=5974 RepID=A0A8J8P5I9_HALGN|nr:hypothetical protein FGO68_gene5061 [Halteria grandinella]